MLNRLFKDHFLNGIIIGFIAIGIDYILLRGIEFIINKATSYGEILQNDRIFLIILAINIILFRFMMVKWNRMQSAKGVFIATIVGMIIFFLFKKSFIHL